MINAVAFVLMRERGDADAFELFDRLYVPARASVALEQVKPDRRRARLGEKTVETLDRLGTALTTLQIDYRAGGLATRMSLSSDLEEALRDYSDHQLGILKGAAGGQAASGRGRRRLRGSGGGGIR